MTQFRVIPEGALSERHLAEWPIWSEHYDFDEIEDIVRWGLDREDVIRLFQENERGNEHCLYTLLEFNPFPPRMRIYIKASLEAATGQHFNGYIMNEDAFCLSVFHNGQEFGFSSHPMLEQMNREQERKLCQALGSPEAQVFPIKYATAYMAESGEPIAGTFHYGAK